MIKGDNETTVTLPREGYSEWFVDEYPCAWSVEELGRALVAKLGPEVEPLNLIISSMRVSYPIDHAFYSAAEMDNAEELCIKPMGELIYATKLPGLEGNVSPIVTVTLEPAVNLHAAAATHQQNVFFNKGMVAEALAIVIPMEEFFGLQLPPIRLSGYKAFVNME